jgi:hypothetical protein
MVLLAAHLDLRAALTVVLAALVDRDVLGAVAGWWRARRAAHADHGHLPVDSEPGLAMAIASVLGRSCRTCRSR